MTAFAFLRELCSLTETHKGDTETLCALCVMALPVEESFAYCFN